MKAAALFARWYQASKPDTNVGLALKKPGPKTALPDSEWQLIQDALLEGPRALFACELSCKTRFVYYVLP